MVPVEGLALEDQNREQGEDGQGDYFLYYLELDEVEGAAVVHEAYAVGGDLEGILEEGDAPREEDDPDQGPVVDELHLLQLEVSVPCESHEYVGHHQQQDSIESGHIGNLISKGQSTN